MIPTAKSQILKILQRSDKPVFLTEIAEELGTTRQYAGLLYHQLAKEHTLPPISYRKRGFGSMDKQKLKIVTTQASKKAHALGKAHKFTTEEASRAGKIGGRSRGREKGIKHRT